MSKLNFVEYGNLEWWTEDDRFCVCPLPEGWVGIDYAPADNQKIDYSPPCDTREEAEGWCNEQAQKCDPSIIVEE